MITWKLKEVMLREDINPSDLAKMLKVTLRTMSTLRGRTMPAIGEERMAYLLLGLNVLKKRETPLIMPNDLIIFSLTPEELSLIEEAERGVGPKS